MGNNMPLDAKYWRSQQSFEKKVVMIVTRIPTPDPIEFLIDRRFPDAKKFRGVPTTVPATGEEDTCLTDEYWESRNKLLADVESYEAELLAMSPDELGLLYEKEQDKYRQERKAKIPQEDQQRFFYLPGADAEFEHWGKLATWTLEEAIALSFGKDPKYVNWNSLETDHSPFPNFYISPFIDGYRRVRDLVLRAKKEKELQDPVLPGDFLAWAKGSGIEFPPKLLALVSARERNSGDIALSLKKESLPGSNLHPLAIFRSMENLIFKEIKIRIDPEKLALRISARGKEATTPFSAIGITKKNEITPNRQGKIFMAMANGNFVYEQRGTDRAISRLSKSLREAFDTPDSPFLTNKPQFQLSIPKDKDAKQHAIRRTTGYSDTRKACEPTDAQAFLQDHDPDYDPDDDLYSDDPDPSVGRQTVCNLLSFSRPRFTFSRMSLADLVQM